MAQFNPQADRRQFLAALAAATAAPSIAHAKDAHTAVRAMIDQYVARKEAANMVVAVGGRKGPPVFISAGPLEIGAAPKAGPDSLYRLASMTKPITGCAIMMLIEEGKLTLDTPLSSIFPGYAQMKVLTDPAHSLAAKPATKQITIRHLVTHSAGLAYAWNLKPPLADFYNNLGMETTRGTLAEEARRPKTLIEFAELMAYAPLLFEPGTSWKYSLGLDVAGAVVEKVSGVPLEEFVAQRIFTPLGMADTSYTVPADKLPRLSGKYGFTASGLQIIETGMNSDFVRKQRYPGGGGGLVSSARDYAKFMAMLLGEGQSGKTRILKTETARLMMSNLMEPGVIATPEVGTRGYGAGGRSVTIATPGGEGVGTYGWTGAFNTQAFVDRANGVYAVLMTQIANWPVNTITADLSKAVYADLAH